MDTELLVGSPVADGERLIQQLLIDGFDVTVAFWVKTSEEGLWRLYIASPSVETETRGEAYHKAYTSLNKIPESEVTPADITVISDKDPIAKAAAEVRDRNLARLPTRYQGKRLGNLSIHEAYIYSPVDPAKVWLRQSFSVKYVRDGDSNNWRATTMRKELYRGLKAKGAVGYSTAWYGEEKPENERFAFIAVLVEIDPRIDEQEILNHPGFRRMWAEQARDIADERFRERHPDAVIEHEEGDD